MQDLETWRKAGRIAAEALEYGKGLIQNGANIRHVCDQVDAKIIALGARPAWPTQVGLDQVAAHFTPDAGDDAVFDGNLVCLDVGAHIDGCIGDNATSVDLSGNHTEVVRASREALDNAIRTVRPGVEVGEIGRVIQETIEGHGLQPVRNLSGHGIRRWVIHDEPSVPNYANGDKRTLVEGEVIAIEPFATNGGGSIHERGRGNLFALVGERPLRTPTARQVLAFVRKEYGALPFTTRWLVPHFGLGKTQLALAEMSRAGMLRAHPPLAERAGGMVAVFEATMLVGETTEILTKPA